jgi:hypothetical protein
MSTALHIVLIVLSVAAVAIGDIFLKKASLGGDFTRAVGSQWMVFAVVSSAPGFCISRSP